MYRSKHGSTQVSHLYLKGRYFSPV